MAVVQRTVQDLVAIINVAINVINGHAEFVAHNNLTLSFLALLDEVYNDNGATVPFEQVLKVGLSGLLAEGKCVLACVCSAGQQHAAP